MYQATEFDLPFPPVEVPDLTAVRTHHLDWLRRFDLLRGERAVDTYLSWELDVAAARFHPQAVGESQQLVTDFYGWLVLWDGQFDGPLGSDPVAAQEVVDGLLAVIRHDPHRGPLTPRLPVGRALQDIWQRESAGMSPRWRQRAARNWADYLQAHVTETVNRASDAVLDWDAYLDLRDVAGASYVILDFAERLGHFEVPDAALDHPAVQELRLITVRVVDHVQDVLSLEKEAARGEPHNAVLILEAQTRVPRPRAVAEIQTIVRAHTDRFLALQAKAPAVADELGLDDAGRTALHQYVDAMRTSMRGNYDWCATSVRYASESVTPPGHPGYLTNTVAPRPA